MRMRASLTAFSVLVALAACATMDRNQSLTRESDDLQARIAQAERP